MLTLRALSARRGPFRPASDAASPLLSPYSTSFRPKHLIDNPEYKCIALHNRLSKRLIGSLHNVGRFIMDRITDSIWIGNYLDGCLADATAEELGMERIEMVQLIDGAGNPPETFLRAVRLLRELVTKHTPVLVHYHAGQSRSAAVVCKYFMTTEGDSLRAAMRKTTSKRRVAIIAGLQEASDFK